MDISPPIAAMAPQPSANTNSGPSNDDAPNNTNANNNVEEPRPAMIAASLDNMDDPTASESKITNIKFINATSYLLTTLMVLGVVIFGVREEGLFGDQFLWMKYQVRVMLVYERVSYCV